ncbi:mitochondrial ATPase complex subunit ATP10 [Aristolochia californica]|uniref:mitochondrial ATPase complex subunit ATP10 n=1 Tax=Aristolochia californica TaxID=171875 RepID=UPI0035D8711E
MFRSSSRRMLLSSAAKFAASRPSFYFLKHEDVYLVPPPNRLTQNRFLDIHEMLSKEAIKKERARIKDEMSRGYFADMAEIKKHGGKIAKADAALIPAVEAVKFPSFDVNFSDGRSLRLPIGSEQNKSDKSKILMPSASLLCLSFRANSQAMIDSWTTPFMDAFGNSSNIQLYEVSVIESWFLSLIPIKQLLLWTMRKSSSDGKHLALQREIGYSFGDKYYFRKELKILNLLTGYIFLLDKFGRIRWQGYGLATEEEMSSLMSCTSQLLEER